MVIAAVEFDADAPLTTLTKQAKLPVTTLRYHLNNLIEQGVLRRYAVVNTPALGYLHWSVYFSLTVAGSQVRDSLLGFLSKHPAVTWLAEFGGSHQFCATLMVRKPCEVGSVLDELAQSFGRVLSNKVITTQTQLSVFPTKHLCSKSGVKRSVGWTDGSEVSEIDETDERLLAALTGQAQFASRREVARHLGLPESTVDHRIKRLLERGIICRFIYLVNPTIFQMLTFKLLVSLHSPTRALRAEIFDFASDHPAITSYIDCIGPWDIELGVEVARAMDVLAVTQALLARFGAAIHSCEELTQFQELKIVAFPQKSKSSPRRQVRT